MQLSLDGKKAGKPIDLYSPSVIPTPPLPIGTFTREEGEHVLDVKIVGANSEAIKSYMCGLDEVVLEEK